MNPTDAGNITLQTLMNVGLSRAACCRINDPNIHSSVLDNNPSTEELEIIAEVSTSLIFVTAIIQSKKLTENMFSIIFERYVSGSLDDSNYYASINTFFEMLVRNKFWNDDHMRQLVLRKVFPEGRVPGQVVFWMKKLPEYADVPREWLETQITVATGVEVTVIADSSLPDKNDVAGRLEACRMDDERTHIAVMTSNPTEEELQIIVNTTTSWNIIYDMVVMKESQNFLTKQLLKQTVERYASGVLKFDENGPPLSWFLRKVVQSEFCDDDILRTLITKTRIPQSHYYEYFLEKVHKFPEYEGYPFEWVEAIVSAHLERLEKDSAEDVTSEL